MPASRRELPGDPRPLRSAWRVAFFQRIMARQVRRSFHALRLSGDPAPAVPADRPLIVYCNHPSWWDAAVLPVLFERLFPGRSVYAPIDAEALSRYRFMRRIGLFGIERGTHGGGATFLRIGSALLEQADTLLCLTPQGHFTDPRQRPIELRPGLVGLLRRVPRATVLPLALEYPFWTERTPEALVRFGRPIELDAGDTRTSAVLDPRLAQGLTSAMDALADDALSRDPGRFVSLLDGRTGVGGVYDLSRRLAAWRRGQRFDPAHDRRPAAPTTTSRHRSVVAQPGAER